MLDQLSRKDFLITHNFKWIKLEKCKLQISNDWNFK